MERQKISIEADFFSNGTCFYKITDKDGRTIDKNMVGIITSWKDLFHHLAELKVVNTDT